MTSVLVAGVGYRNLRDLSVGPALIERLRQRTWPPNVQVEDLSFGAIHVLHWLRDQPKFDRAVLIAAAARGRKPGTIHHYAWKASTTTAEEVQQCVSEAVTGIISLQTLLTVLAYFDALPATVNVLEIEPRDTDWGTTFSPAVESALDHSVELIERDIAGLVAA